MNEISHQSCQQVQIVEKLLMTSKLVMMQLDKALDDAGLSAAKIWALKHLIESDCNLGVTQLADCMGSGKSNATQLIDRLEAEGLVQRIRHPNDRRSVLVEVTEEGMARYQAGIELRRQTAQTMLDVLSDDQRNQLAIILETIRDSL